MACGDDGEGDGDEPESVRAGVVGRSLLQPVEERDLVGVGDGPAADVERYDELAPPEGFPGFAEGLLCCGRKSDQELVAGFFQVDSFRVLVFVLNQTEFCDKSTG